MYKIGYLGNFEKVPQVVEYILNSDVENLEKEYKNGQAKSIENFKNGKLNGEFKEFFEDGNLSQIATFKNGDMKNIKVFYENGNLKFEQNLKNRKGKYRGYYPNGQLESEGEVFQGDEIGLWKYYNEEGNLLKTEYKNNQKS